MRLALALALALALLLAVAAPARAATIRTIPQTCDRAGCSGGYSVFEAAPGERNDVRVTRDGARPGPRAAVHSVSPSPCACGAAP